MIQDRKITKWKLFLISYSSLRETFLRYNSTSWEHVSRENNFIYINRNFWKVTQTFFTKVKWVTLLFITNQKTHLEMILIPFLTVFFLSFLRGNIYLESLKWKLNTKVDFDLQYDTNIYETFTLKYNTLILSNTFITSSKKILQITQGNFYKNGKFLHHLCLM